MRASQNQNWGPPKLKLTVFFLNKAAQYCCLLINLLEILYQLSGYINAE